MTLIDGLVAYYKLDGNANDSVGNYHGTASNMSWTTGKIGQAGNFTKNNNSRILITNSGQFSFSGKSFSVSFWINANQWPSSSGVHAYTIIDFETPNWKGWLIRQTPPNQFLSGNSDQQLSTGLPTAGQWSLVTFTSNGTNGVMYFNGSHNRTTTTLTYPSNSSTTYAIGANGENWTTAQGFDGKLCEVGIWNRALSSAEISELYNNGKGLTYPFIPTKKTSNFLPFFIK